MVPLAVGLVRDRVSLLIERKISATHRAGKGSCRQAEIPFLHEAGMVTRLVSPLSPLFFLHRQKCCSLLKPSSVSHFLRCMMHQPKRSRCSLLDTFSRVGAHVVVNNRVEGSVPAYLGEEI